MALDEEEGVPCFVQESQTAPALRIKRYPGATSPLLSIINESDAQIGGLDHLGNNINNPVFSVAAHVAPVSPVVSAADTAVNAVIASLITAGLMAAS